MLKRETLASLILFLFFYTIGEVDYIIGHCKRASVPVQKQENIQYQEGTNLLTLQFSQKPIERWQQLFRQIGRSGIQFEHRVLMYHKCYDISELWTGWIAKEMAFSSVRFYPYAQLQ